MKEKFYCNLCKKDVELEDGICPECKTNWTEMIEEGVNGEKFKIRDKEEIAEIADDEEVEEFDEDDEEVPTKKVKKYNELKYIYQINEESINKNIEFYLRWAKNMSIIFVIYTIIVLIIGLELLVVEDEEIGWVIIFSAILIDGYGMIMKNNARWKAHMLYLNKKNK